MQSSFAVPVPAGTPSWADLVAHAVLFGSLCAALRYAWVRQAWRAPLVAPVAVTVAYGVLDEWHQRFVPGRSSSARDVLADAVGAVVVALASHRFTVSRPPDSDRGRRTTSTRR